MKELISGLITWIKDYVKSTNAKGVVIGMSGGKDSLVVAKLCVEALGKENVFGLIMPNGKMCDKNDAEASCKLLGIRYASVDISKAYEGIIKPIEEVLDNNQLKLSDITTINTPPRLRMAMLYAVAGSMNYLVANTSNLSEISVGYSTKWGDSVGDFAPIANFTKTEVCEIGRLLGLPIELVEKTPSDGLSGKSDEEKLGLTYDNLDEYIRTGKKNEDYETIMKLHSSTMHKRKPISKFENKLKNFLN